MSELCCGHATKYLVNLTDDERAQLESLLANGTGKTRVLTRARILLAADRDDPAAAIADALHVHPRTVADVRKRCVDGGLDRARPDAPRPGAARKLAGAQEAFGIALACRPPPEGRERWTTPISSSPSRSSRASRTKRSVRR